MPPTREIFPFVIGSMSFGALSPNMWLGLLQGVAYCNEVLGIPWSWPPVKAVVRRGFSRARS
ncbi:hypothetical protein VU00_11181 [Candidatus Electrothrix marina]|uniref:Uncharacterized protein n=1 Tax=Candidatus Electrothrix marina TaxID=1859130 RepID=A0A3S3SU69_9BACT|nr:hypothetical protein VU00_11181 [Candidatus Electrothrix marina]